MDMILVKCIFKIRFLNFSNICCWYTLELPHRGNSNVHIQHMVIQQIRVLHHKTVFFPQTLQLLFFVSV